MEESTKQEGKEKQKEEYKKEMVIVRIMQTDIAGKKQIYTGLTKIKGVSWSLANAICNKMGLDKKKKIGTLSAEEIKKIEAFIKNPEFPAFLLNRRNDIDTGKDMHLVTTDLELRKEFDIRRFKKIRSYRGLRHALRQPVRGQRTKAHFREKGRAIGVVKKGKIGKKS